MSPMLVALEWLMDLRSASQSEGSPRVGQITDHYIELVV